MTQFWFEASAEEFLPSEMLEQAQAAEGARFDALMVSDHFAPWWPEGRASGAWPVLGALGQVTSLPIGTGVTPIVHHYHPAVIAQFAMALEELYPGRVVLGIGSGEALNEVPLGLDPFPSPAEKIERFGQGMEAIWRLWAGETVTMDAGWFKLKEAKLYTRARTRPRLIPSAFGPQAAAVAARHGDGLWTLGDPESAPEVIEAFRSAGGTGEVVFQAGFHLAETEEAAIAAAAKWKPTQVAEAYNRDVHDQDDMRRRADEQMSDEEFAHSGFLVGADAAEHVERIREMERAGATVVCLQLIGDADPMGSIRRYGEQVLPALRGPSAAG